MAITTTGIGLSSVTPLKNNSVLRVVFTTDPKQSNSAESNDALNVSNWSLTGPGFVSIFAIASVGSDPKAVDITLNSPLLTGDWTIKAVNITTSDGMGLVEPTFITINIPKLINPTNISPGTHNDDAVSILRKHLNPALKGQGWDAVVKGLSAGDAPNAINTKLAFDQLYVSSASGVYLDRITANSGIQRPKNVGISDDIYRHLAIKVTNNKVVNEALLEVLAVYYGEDAVRAHVTTESFEPYALNDGDDLNITIDGLYKVNVVFHTNDFKDIGNATAAEIAGAITRSFIIDGVHAFARPFSDPQDGKTKVNIYTGSLGLKGSVQIKGSGGGTSQLSLKFPTFLNVYTGSITPAPPGSCGSVVINDGYAFTWTQVEPMRVAREQSYVGQFQDLRSVFMGGGNSLGYGSFNSADSGVAGGPSIGAVDMYSADGLTRTSLPDTPIQPLDYSMPLLTLGDGRMLLVSRLASHSATLDPNTLTWTLRAPFPGALGSSIPPCCVLPNGNAIYFGSTASYEYDQGTDAWITRPATPEERSQGIATVLQTGNVFIAGGDPGDLFGTVYNTTTHTYSATSGMLDFGIIFHGQVLMPNGCVLIVGGEGFGGTAKEVYTFNPLTGNITRKGDLPFNSTFPGLIALDNGYILSIAGNGNEDTAWFYDPNNDTWVSDGNHMEIGRVYGGRQRSNVVYLGGDKILVAGGEAITDQDFGEAGPAAAPTQSVEVSNLGADSTYPNPPIQFGFAQDGTNLSQARGNMGIITLNNGKHLCVGGQNKADYNTPTTWYSNVDIISADGTSVAATGSLPWAASRVKVTKLGDGRVLAVGGQTDATHGASNAATIDVTGTTWTARTAAYAPLRDHGLVTMGVDGVGFTAGDAMLIGGLKNDGTASASTKFYHQADNTWVNGPDLLTGRYGFGIVAEFGTVTIFGGVDSDGNLLKDSESFNFNNNEWVSGGEQVQLNPNWQWYRPDTIFLPESGLTVFTGGYLGDTLVGAYNPSNTNIQFSLWYVPLGITSGGFSLLLSNMSAQRADGGLLKVPKDDDGTFFYVYMGGEQQGDPSSTDIFDPIRYQTYSRDFIGNEGDPRPLDGFAYFTTSDHEIKVIGGYLASDGTASDVGFKSAIEWTLG